jgi:hypothetical protein
MQKPRELGRDALPGQHRGNHPRRPAHVQGAKGQPQPLGPGGQPRQPRQRRVGGQILGTAGHHQAHLPRLPGGKEQHELQRRIIGPVHVLHHKHRRPQAAKQLSQGGEQPVPRRGRIPGRLGHRRQLNRPLREQRAQRPGQGTQPQAADVADGLAQRVGHRGQRQRLAERRARRHQRPVLLTLVAGQALADQPALADSRLALDQHYRGRARQCAGQRGQFPATAHEPRSPHRQHAPGIATFGTRLIEHGEFRSSMDDHVECIMRCLRRYGTVTGGNSLP